MAEYKNNKYNAQEVRITRCVFALFLFVIMAVSVNAVRRLHLFVSRSFGFQWTVFITTALLWALSIFLIFKMKSAKTKGITFGHKIWGIDYVVFLLSSLSAAHTILVIFPSPDVWRYAVPIAYTLLGILYALYVLAWDMGESFKSFGLMSGAAGIGIMLTYQSYYNSGQIFTPDFHLLTQEIAMKVGAGVLAVVLLVLLYLRIKKNKSVWKQIGVVLIFALYWILLWAKVWSGFWLSVVAASVEFVWFILLRILKKIRVIS
jgi:hypothetical protein